jgi:hypothetical protein
MPVVLITSRFEGIEVEINRHSAFVTHPDRCAFMNSLGDRNWDSIPFSRTSNE